MRKLIVANWKMQLTEINAVRLAQEYRYNLSAAAKKLDLAVAPAFLHLKDVGGLIRPLDFCLGAQNISPGSGGAMTGEISGKMLREARVEYVIVGHSERRAILNETDELINKKIGECFNSGLTPILCIGETAGQKKNNKREAVLVQQIQRGLEGLFEMKNKELVIAYEPVWAIGSGEFPAADDIEAVTRLIKRAINSLATEKYFNEKVRVLYGGSVGLKNAAELARVKFLDGILASTVSLNAREFADVAGEFIR